MSNLQSYIDAVDETTARAALYYLGRYVKQAGYFDKYGKDIFEDEVRSAPSEEVMDVARKMMAALEDREGCPASEFDDALVLELLREITALEDELGPEIGVDELAHVNEFVSRLQTPHSNKNDS